MFSELATSWPNSNMGFKHIIEEVSEEYTFTLQSLHEGAWWTGFQVSSVSQTRIAVVLRRSGGSVAFDTAPDQCKWTLTCGTWCHFPWPVPAAMADAMGLYLDISLIEESVPSYLSMKASFHEMTGLEIKDQYLFIAGDGVSEHHWDGDRQVWGNPIAGSPPTWNTMHTVVPTMAQLLATGVWNDDKMFTIQEWADNVPPA
jgi:hypothetical protein